MASAGFARDSSPAEALLDRSDQAQRTSPDESMRLAREALALLAEAPDPDLEVRARALLCSYLADRDTIAAEREADEGAALTPKLKRSALSAGILGCRGEISETLGDNARAMSFYQQEVEVAEGGAEQRLLADGLFQRGYLQGVQGEYAKALADLWRSRALYQGLDLPPLEALALNAIASVYGKMGDFAQARDYYIHALEVQRELGLSLDQAATWHGLGRAYDSLRNWADARTAFEGARRICHDVKFARGEAHALLGLASVRNALGDPGGALVLLSQADTLQRLTNDALLHARIQLQRGIAFGLKRRPADGLPALNEAMATFNRADSQVDLISTLGALAKTLGELGDWRAAYEFHRQFKAASERRLESQLDQRFAALKVHFDTEAKARENRLLRRERDAVKSSLQESLKVGRLQVAVIALSAMLTLLLALAAARTRRTSARLKFLAMTDELTGLPNRRAVLTRLRKVLECPRTVPCALMIADVDHFKQINDRLGHAVGDDVLRAVSTVLTETASEPLFVGRIGGEEFLVVQPEADFEKAHLAAERIRAAVNAIDAGRWFADRCITVSLGVAVSLPTGEAEVQLLARADAALFEAKNAGRNRVVVRDATQVAC